MSTTSAASEPSPHHHEAGAKPALSSDEIYAQKWDRCASKAVQYAVPPLAVGVVAMFASRRIGKWILLSGAPFGLGMAYAECAFSFKRPDMVHVTRLSSVDQHNKV